MQKKTNPVRRLYEKARDCEDCAKRRERVRNSWNTITGKKKRQQ